MEENPPPSGKDLSRRKGLRLGNDHPRRSSSRKGRFTAEEAGESVDCSGKNCRSCTAALIADCVAVCCCPLALVSLLALAFVKVPFLVGRNCFRRAKRKRKKCKKIAEASVDCDFIAGITTTTTTSSSSSREMSFKTGVGGSSLGKSDIIFEFGVEEELEERKSFCASFEADKVLMELYQVGHLGFGRVSFTGIPSFGKGN